MAAGRTQYCCSAHGEGVRCKLAGCNRVAIGKVQLRRAHGGGTLPRRSNGGDMSSASSVLFGGGGDSGYMDDENVPDQSISAFADWPTI